MIDSWPFKYASVVRISYMVFSVQFLIYAPNRE